MTTISIFEHEGVEYMLVSFSQHSGTEDLQLLRKEYVEDKGWKEFKQRGRNRIVAGRPTRWVKVRGRELSPHLQEALFYRMHAEALLSDIKKIERSEEKLVIIAC